MGNDIYLQPLKQGRMKKEVRDYELTSVRDFIEIEDSSIHRMDLMQSFKRMTKKPGDFGFFKLSTKNNYGDYLMAYCKVDKVLKLREEFKILIKEHSGLKNGLNTGSKDFWWNTENDFLLFIGEENWEKVKKVFAVSCNF